ncbi:MAG: aminomethyl-transferring glycine dehydrogenase subunit GcvPB [Victivallales bacterium]|nr:aminomethyl-transferring glycine dehydrogenase subunit GcvPB [Victivallales bacterium]MCF7888629.1 aminomethyl-transferring glycine dehydrogenase subunit GcvPB [Victivallales bacterium]
MELIYSKSREGRRGVSLPDFDVPEANAVPEKMMRKEPANLPEVSEQDAVRYYINLSKLNIGVDTNFYPLGSCTMKYNPKINEVIAKLEGFAALHPLLPQLKHGAALTQGALQVIYDMERMLCELLGFAQFTMQPMAGAHGELTGIMMIAAYHKANNDHKRKVMLIPDAAHGTNPASAAMNGFETREIPTDDHGNVDIPALKEVLGPDVAGLMLTAPSTLGLFDENVKEVCNLCHEAGALIYCDGANLNALFGRVRPGDMGFDVMHVNLHKSFSTPHGGGGPGSGPVGVSEKLAPFLPISRITKMKDGTYCLGYDYPKSIGFIAPFYGNFGVILKAYAYMLSIGRDGFLRISENAVLNANYIRTKLKPYYKQLFDRHCMHECVFSVDIQKEKYDVSAMDIAKGLLDRGIHPPTMYFPLIVHEALMIEPTETESKETLEEFIDAMIELAKLAEENPDEIKKCPVKTPLKRLDEALAARKPVVKLEEK